MSESVINDGKAVYRMNIGLGSTGESDLDYYRVPGSVRNR